MREIKFRYRHKGKESGDVFMDHFTLEELYQGKVTAGFKEEKYWEFLGRDEFTGLKDRNGKEIYEGDILKGENGAFGEVYYNEKTWAYLYRNGWGHPVEGYPHPLHSEIIGNIHENPELISEGKAS